MSKDYIKFILAYDYGSVFEAMELACDEAFELAEEITNRYRKWLKKNDDPAYPEYEILQRFLNDISFYDVWQEVLKERY